MALFTGKGDGGETGLANGQRLPKDSDVIEALGSVDEVNAWLGVCRSYAANIEMPGKYLAEILLEMQQDLFVIQAVIGGSDKQLEPHRIADLENLITKIQSALPPMKGFIVYGQNSLSAWLDVARAVARRAERRMVTLDLPSDVKVYMNRLSDALYALARSAASLDGSEVKPNY